MTTTPKIHQGLIMEYNRRGITNYITIIQKYHSDKVVVSCSHK